MKDRSLPPFIGIRIKNFGADTHARGIRTMDLFLTALAQATGGKLPENFVVMLPKVVSAEQTGFPAFAGCAVVFQDLLAKGFKRQLIFQQFVGNGLIHKGKHKQYHL
jgi:hypothetical protein